MKIATTQTPGAIATVTLKNSPSDDVERLAAAFRRMEPQDIAAWQDDFDRIVDREWAQAIATQRRLRNGNLVLGLSGLVNAPNMVKGLYSEIPAVRAASVAGLLGTAAGFSMAAWSTYDMAMNPRRHRAHQE